MTGEFILKYLVSHGHFDGKYVQLMLSETSRKGVRDFAAWSSYRGHNFVPPRLLLTIAHKELLRLGHCQAMQNFQHTPNTLLSSFSNIAPFLPPTNSHIPYLFLPSRDPYM